MLAAQQTAPSPGITIAQAVESALKNYPSIRVSQEQINAAAAGIQLARTAYLPRIDVLAQVNRATRNNVFGLLLPQSVIPSMSGPVLGTNNFGTAWGSAMGALVTWEPFDFGLRQASVDAATAARAQSRGGAQAHAIRCRGGGRGRLPHPGRRAGDGARRAGRRRPRRGALANHRGAGERPIAARRGCIASRGRTCGRAHATDPGAAGGGDRRAPTCRNSWASNRRRSRSPRRSCFNCRRSRPWLRWIRPPIRSRSSRTPSSSRRRAQLRILERSYFPRFYLQGSAYARGTGAEVNGTNLGGLNGLGATTSELRARVSA